MSKFVRVTFVRVSAVLPGLIILALIYSYIEVFDTDTRQEAAAPQSDSAGKPDAKLDKSSKKRKKKKRKTSVSPYLSLLFPAMQNSLPAPDITNVPSLSNPTPLPTSPRQTTRIARTPGVHISPVSTPVTAAPPAAFTGGPITIGAVNPDSDPAPAVPYSSDIEVSGLTGVVTAITVTINNLSHNQPDDLDMLLIAPNGRSFHFWSDVGGTNAATGVTITISNSGATHLPDSDPLVGGSPYRPSKADRTGDDFPVPHRARHTANQLRRAPIPLRVSSTD